MEVELTKLLICAVPALSCLSALAQARDQHRGSVEQEIVALEHSWAAAQRANDPATIAQILADSYVEVLPDGSLLNKAQVLEDAKGGKYETIKLSDLKITRFGDTVIVVGTFDAKHFDKSGKLLQDHERYVDTWRKTLSGRWQCIAEGNTAIR